MAVAAEGAPLCYTRAMADIFTKKKRSEVMSRIRSRGNRDTELALVKLLRAMKVTGWRRHASLKGKGKSEKEKESRVRPDFVFPKLRVAVFVDGCFWHGCPRHGTRPKGNASFWKEKLERNMARDRAQTRALKRAGWRVLRIWEHELARKNEARLRRRLERACAGK